MLFLEYQDVDAVANTNHMTEGACLLSIGQFRIQIPTTHLPSLWRAAQLPTTARPGESRPVFFLGVSNENELGHVSLDGVDIYLRWCSATFELRPTKPRASDCRLMMRFSAQGHRHRHRHHRSSAGSQPTKSLPPIIITGETKSMSASVDSVGCRLR